MDKRFKLWVAVSIALFLINALVFSWLRPAVPKPAANKPAAAKPADQKAKEGEAKPNELAEKPDPAKTAPEVANAAEAEKPAEGNDAAEKPVAAVETPPRWLSFGSGDPKSPFRMLVTATNVGAAIERIELNSPRYLELEDRSGYMGHLSLIDVPKLGGAKVRVVGEGTPAHEAGLKVDDIIVGFEDKTVTQAEQFDRLLKTTESDSTIKITIERDGNRQPLSVKLRRRPLEVVRPERDSKSVDVLRPGKHDPLSLLLTLQAIDDQAIEAPKDFTVGKELPKLDLWNGTWEVVNSDNQGVTFRKTIPDAGLEITKSFKLAMAKAGTSVDDPAYHLVVEISIRNVGEKARTVSYQLDGPTGLPIEGAWYATKVNRSGGSGLRDFVVRFGGENDDTTEVGPTQLIDKKVDDSKAPLWIDPPNGLDFVAVDAQYFAAALIPQKKAANDLWFSDVRPLRVSTAIPKDKADYKLIDVSFRLTSKPELLEPNGKPLVHEYKLFAGPKRPTLLEKYPATPVVEKRAVTLDELVYYGWFGKVARPMLAVLHFFYDYVHNYGIAILMLTVLVRAAMFPISRKQAISAQKMQEIQPQIKAIAEKYKSDPQGRQKAQMELFRKHNYNPIGGCLPMFFQLPIFIGLYRSLSVDVELRQAPLISESVRWCSNLSAPDMLYNWSSWMPEMFQKGFFVFPAMGPYLNVFPLITMGLFLWQQKLFTPPAMDEQTAQTQKMMKYMMFFMGLMFFKVASGLCLYFIASSLWGITERKLLPKTLPPSGGNLVAAKTSPPTSSLSNGNGKGKKKQRR